MNGTNLTPGDVVLSVNSVSPNDAAHAGELVRSATDAVVIVAYSPSKARLQAVEFVFRDYDIQWNSSEECEVSMVMGSGRRVKFVLLFSPETNMAAHVDISAIPYDSTSRTARDARIDTAKKVLMLNDILLDGANCLSSLAVQTVMVPVQAEPIKEMEAVCLMSDLEKLVNLRREGLLTDCEFSAAKARVLDLAANQSASILQGTT